MDNPQENIKMESSELIAGIVINFIKLAKKSAEDNSITHITVEAHIEDGSSIKLHIDSGGL